MKIDIVTLCDAALEVNGRLHVLGTIDYFWSASLPYIHPKCTLAVRFRWEGHERIKKHKVRVQVVDADGQAIASEFSRKFATPEPGEDIPPIRILLVEMEQLSFENYGPYAVRIELDGEEVASVPFGIVPQARMLPKASV